MHGALGIAMVGLIAACGGGGDILAPDTAAVPLRADNLTGRWAEVALIHHKFGAQTGVIVDTVRVKPADQAIYQFNLDGAGIVRRIQPDTGQATYAIDGPNSIHWNMDRFEGYGATLSATRLSLGDGLEIQYTFPGDNFPSPAQVLHVYTRVKTP